MARDLRLALIVHLAAIQLPPGHRDWHAKTPGSGMPIQGFNLTSQEIAALFCAPLLGFLDRGFLGLD